MDPAIRVRFPASMHCQPGLWILRRTTSQDGAPDRPGPCPERVAAEHVAAEPGAAERQYSGRRVGD
jgi:hypothetical protein